MHIKIGSYEAKTKLPELLHGVQVGNRYTITLRGAAVADLVPAKTRYFQILLQLLMKCGALCVPANP